MKAEPESSAANTTPTNVNDDILFNTSYTRGGYLGWVRTDETSDPWKRFGIVSNERDTEDYGFDRLGVGVTIASSGRTFEVSGETLITGNATVTGILTATGGISGSGIIPVGGIIMWSGIIADIPATYQLCDGTNGTPDLRNKFVICADADVTVGNELITSTTARTTVEGVPKTGGGSKDAVIVTHNHSATSTTTTTIADHNHGLTQSAHSHTISITDPGHVHSYVDQVSDVNAGYRNWPSNNNDCGQQPKDTDSAFTGISASASSESITISVDNESLSPSSSTTTSIANNGESGTNANLPPYYALAFIMRIS